MPAFYYGTSPNNFFDYVSAGIPGMNNYPGWLGDLIARHGCGMVVPPDNPAALADALIRLADEPNLREAMGRNAHLLAVSAFDRATLSARFVSVVKEVAAGSLHSA